MSADDKMITEELDITERDDFKMDREFLLEEMEKLLDEYGYSYNDFALENIIDEWAHQKEELIEAFKKHPKYVKGKYMIAYDKNYEREIDTKKVDFFLSWIRLNVVPYMKDTLPEKILNDMNDGLHLPLNIYCLFTNLSLYKSRTIEFNDANYINNLLPEVHAHEGQKTSRVMNQICTYLGYNKHQDYNREFAKFADALSPMTIKRHTILSINPLDYLTMSFGNSWASCHTIDKRNKRNMPNSYEGQYSSGTMSYMLDTSSMVLYTVDAAYQGTDYWTQPKINRQMFHWGEKKLVQGRLYPQGNDGDKSAYEPYRKLVQEIMSTIYDFPNFWTMNHEANKYIHSIGTHYRDYLHFESCTLSKIKDNDNINSFVVGAAPICIECGERHMVESNINCCCDEDYEICSSCGRELDEDEAHYINGEPYCNDCVWYCDECGSYFTNETFYVESANRYVCNDCLDNYYTYCEYCEEYVQNEETVYIDGTDEYVCETCYSNHYFECEECGVRYPSSNANRVHNRIICNDCLDKQEEEDKENEKIC